jgi:hypothetical protein
MIIQLEPEKAAHITQKWMICLMNAMASPVHSRERILKLKLRHGTATKS